MVSSYTVAHKNERRKEWAVVLYIIRIDVIIVSYRSECQNIVRYTEKVIKPTV